ncbi:hypothetical protein QTG54_002854 [Skeletonema marinoi]|uniref:Uncharacterized protein n=1 Tax=Skeletonema marinoi TaxID=267567 RepID=A0AAD9DGE8_9STRA|nr:hypothetical protein QTG54_002854 [Skeletonema marinoi]
MTEFNQEELLENWPCRCADSDVRPFCAAEKAGRDTLLEHWPKRTTTFASFDSVEVDVASVSSKRHRYHLRSVHFSETSQLHVYERESKYLLRSLTYTKDDRDEFGKDALLEGLRIKNLVATAPPESTAESIKYLLRHDLLRPVEPVGIEHFFLTSPKMSSRGGSAMQRLCCGTAGSAESKA